MPDTAPLEYGSPQYFAMVGVILGHGEAHRRIAYVEPEYRIFATIAHLRADHGVAEILPERANAAHELFTAHEMALALADV